MLGTACVCRVCGLLASDRSAERGVVANGLMIFPRSEKGATLEYECQCDVGSRVSGIASWPPVRLFYIWGGACSRADPFPLLTKLICAELATATACADRDEGRATTRKNGGNGGSASNSSDI